MNTNYLFLFLSIGSLLSSCQDNMDSEEAELPEVSISGATQNEGDTNNSILFSVSISSGYDGEVSVDYTTIQNTAGENIDYNAASGKLIIPPGSRQGNIEIEVIGDTIREHDETFLVVISNPKNAVLSTDKATGTISDDDINIYIPPEGYATTESHTGYNLVWQDEFAGQELNSEYWTHETGGDGWGNQELQYYTDSSSNSYQNDGKLIIEAIKEDFGGNPYTSARIITKDKKSFKFGRIDIRAKLPEGQGLWPALWMLGSNISEVGWPACGEIDIMELVGHQPSRSHGTAHWGPQGQSFSSQKGGQYVLSSEKFSDKFHVFTIVWTAQYIEWFVDDLPFFKLNRSMVDGAYPFENDFFFIFNIAVGGQWPGSPDETTEFPQKMIVDYLRVFQLK